VRLEGLGKLKKSTSSGFDPATFRLVTVLTKFPMNSFNVMKISDPHKYSTVKEFDVRINWVIVSYMYEYLTLHSTI
jgi:hypothetical protein